jgi:hypothetical protein
VPSVVGASAGLSLQPVPHPVAPARFLPLAGGLLSMPPSLGAREETGGGRPCLTLGFEAYVGFLF